MNLNHLILRTSVYKKALMKLKRQAINWERMLLKQIIDKGLVFRISKELPKLSIR